MKILVVNCGSSSIKCQLRSMPTGSVLADGQVERIGESQSTLAFRSGSQTLESQCTIGSHADGMRMLLEAFLRSEDHSLNDLTEIGAVGHRVVHGGETFSESVVISPAVIAKIKDYAKLAPLHNLAHVMGIQAAQAALKDVPHIACFDTAFHATIPPVAYLYGLPIDLYRKYEIRRYGFHGSSHRYVAARTAALHNKPAEQLNCITIHLGNGCSMAAIKNGKSIDTSMGFTPLEGLMMGTRCGDIDPAIIFFLAGEGYSIDQLNQMCNKESGLVGISSLSNDMRSLTEAAQVGNREAELAIDVFCYRAKKYLGAYMAVLGTVDAVSFTGGIGEHAVGVRRKICGELERLGIVLDLDQNERLNDGEGPISTAGSPIQVYVVPTNEELVIARDTFDLVTSEGVA